MLFRVFTLLSLYAASVYGQDLVCGFGLAGEDVSGMSTHHADIDFYRGVDRNRTEPVHVLPLVGKLKDVASGINFEQLYGRTRSANDYQAITDLFNPSHTGSLPHFLNEMSYGKLSFEAPNRETVAGTVYVSSMTKTTRADYGLRTAADCLGPDGRGVGGWADAVEDFALDVVRAADADVDFNDYDGDGDGKVDLVAVLTPSDFGDLCKVNGTVFYELSHSTNDYIDNDPTKAKITVETIITGDQVDSFPSLVGILAHEYGHVMGLPELYDRTNIRVSRTDYDNHSAGVGFWGMMGKGADGYVKQAGVPDGPTPLSAWSRIEVGWITDSPTDDRLDTVTGDQTLQIHDINSDDGKVYKIEVPSKSDEYFLLSNRQNTYNGTASSIGSYYDTHAPASGLLIWHIDEDVKPHRPIITQGNRNPYSRSDVNAIEEHKRVDVECADGLWDHAGPGTTSTTLIPIKNIESGGDNLDYWTGDDKDWRDEHRGNLGDAGDVWTSGEFTPTSNPSTAGYSNNGTRNNYSDDRQDEFTGIAVRNIQARPNGVMQADIVFLPLEPANLRAEAGVRQVTLRWAAPMPNGGSAITGYEYRHSLDGGRTWMTRTLVDGGAMARSQIVGELTAGTLYTFEVRAVNASGSGGWASATATPVPSAPSASVTAGFRRIHVDWTPVASATGYDVQVQSKPFDRGPWPAAWSSVATNTAGRIPNNRPSLRRETHTGVSSDSLYRYQVRSRAGASVSGWSALVPDAAGIQPGVGAPTGFRAESGAGQVTLRWTGPDHASITQWRYRDVTALGADTQGGWQDLVVSGRASTEWSAPVEGLTPGRAYRFQLRAVNGAGGGQPSAVSNMVTPRVPVCSLTGPPAPTFAENATGVVGTYTASAGCGSALSWKLAGTDARFFELKGEGMSCTLEFDSSHSPPNFERPADADKNNTYAVSVSIGEVSVSVTVSVTDANDAGVIRLSTPAPRAGQSLTATLSDEDGIAEPVSWTPHYEGTSDGGGVTGQASEATQTWTLTIPNSRVGQLLRIQADYTDSFGAASALSAWTSPVRPAANRAPSVSGPASVDIAENSLAPWLLGTYTGRDPDGDELTWSVTGPDASAFELKAPASPGAEPSRALHLASAADYETQASYDVWVKVSDAALSDSLRVSVSVINQNEEGEVVLTGGLPPEVGTAVVAALTDPDGQITGASWQWQRRLGATGAWEALGSGVSGAASAYPELSSYRPVSGDVGWQLQATVRYRDGHDPNAERTAASDPSRAVVGPPVAPSAVSVRSGWTQVRVEWSAVVAATGYAVQGQSAFYDGGSWPTTWTSLASEVVGPRRYVHRGVSPDSLYRYQVRARVGELASAWSVEEPPAGVQPGVGPPTGFTAEAGASQATLRWTGPSYASITQWRYRDVTAEGADTDGGWQDATVSGSASAGWSAPVEGLTAGQAYRFQVRAVNGAGGGRPSVVSNTVTPWLARPTGGSVSVQAGPALEVAWSSVASATGYEVQGQSKPFDSGSWPSAWTTQQANGAQPYVHQGVDADRRYRYRVRARVGETASAWSDTLPGVAGVQPPPGAPTGLTATPGIRQATLRWTGPTHESITEWQYKRGQILEPITAWAGWRSMGTAAATRSVTVREPLVDGGSYRFEVRARNGGGWSAGARTDTVTLPVDTKGSVALSTTTPQVGDDLTATLTDPDNPTDVRFGWSYHRPAGVSGANGADPPPSALQSSMFYESGSPMAPARDAL